jgi:hypothetical protein
MGNDETVPLVQTGNRGDFVMTDLVKVHDQDIQKLVSRVEAFEEKFGSNEKIGKTLCETAEESTKMRSMLASTFAYLIEHDVPTKQALTKLLNSEDRKAVWSFVKRFGFVGGAAIWTVITLVLGAWLGSLFQK